MSKLQEKPSALKRGHPTLQNMNFYKFFLLLWVIFALLDPGPDSESGSTGPIEYGSNPDPDPKPWSEAWIRGSGIHTNMSWIRNTARRKQKPSVDVPGPGAAWTWPSLPSSCG
jgi:hypothetical protein